MVESFGVRLGRDVDHQQDVMFLTFFIYRNDGSPYWVTAVLGRVDTNAKAPFVFTGDMVETRGPYFGGGDFNPSLVSNRRVGSATFTGADINSAILTYSVDGVSKTQSLQRQTLRSIDYSGIYNGTTAYALSNCPVPSNNNRGESITGELNIHHSGVIYRMLIQGTTVSCLFDGTSRNQALLAQRRGRCNARTAQQVPLPLIRCSGRSTA
jgi:hypothetical protein